MANQDDVITYVTDSVFRSTWNNILAEHRINILMTKTKPTYVTGSVMLGASRLMMPDTGPFMVLQTNRLFTDNITTPADVWINSGDLINKFGAYLHLYGVEGRVLPKNEVYLYTPHGGGKSFIAVKYSAMNMCGYRISSNFYATVYLDSDQKNNVTHRSFVIPSDSSSIILQARIYVSECMTKSLVGTHVFYNGELIDPTTFMSMTPESQSRIDVVLDTNITCEFVVDARANLGYYSDLYKDYRYLLHCPKHLNPNNAAITHNTIEIFVRDKVTRRARYLHRTDVNAVTQITHNDFAINTTVIEAFVDSMGTGDVEFVVKVRRHSNENVLLNDSHFIKTLYLLDDATIIRCLLSKEDSRLSFWSAQSLESSGYTKLMFDVPNVYTETTLDELVDALGIPQIVSMTARAISHIPRNPGNKTVIADVPVALWDVPVYPVVYVNGVYVSSDVYSYSRPSIDTLVVSLIDAFYLPPDAIISVRLLENVLGNYTPVVWVPSVTEKTITITGKECHVYKVVDVDPVDLPSGGTTTVGYAPLTPSGGTMVISQTGNNYTITVGSSLYGTTLIIYRGNAIMRREITTSIDDAVARCAPICYTLTVEASDGRMVPALNHSVDVFLNRAYLANTIGYVLTDIKRGNVIVSREMAITDRRYLTETNNSLILIYHTEDTIISDTFYAVDGKLSYDTSVSPWIVDASSIHAHGVITSAIEHGQWLTIADTSNVTEYDMRTTIPDGLSKILSKYSMTPYNNRLAIINAYLQNTLPVDSARVIITDSYRMYSPYTCAIIADVLSGAIGVSNDPNPTKFMAQFQKYEHYKQVDVAFLRPASYNLMFVDILPNTGEANLSVPQYAALRRLINSVLSDDTQTEGNMING